MKLLCKFQDIESFRNVDILTCNAYILIRCKDLLYTVDGETLTIGKETTMKNPKKFSWKVTAKDKPLPGTVVCQEQCSSGGGGNGKCGSK